MLHFFKLIRYKNLLLLALMQLVFRFGYLELINIPLSLFYWQYALLILATTFIAAGGYVINDIFDQETDFENKPNNTFIGKKIPENNGYKIYVALTIVGVACGFVLANSVSHPNFSIIFVLIATLLYFYATTFKQLPLVGNIVVATLLAFSIIIIGVFDIFPNTFDFNRQQMTLAFSILFDYAKFAFCINLVREIIKDIQDYKGDFANGINTLPVKFGIFNTNKFAFVILLLTTIYLFYYTKNHLFESSLFYGFLYMVILVIAPLIFCLVQIWNAKETKHYKQISSLLKWIIFFGIMSIAVITLNINYNV